MTSMLNPAPGPPTERGVGPSDPALSAAIGTSYTGTGYSPTRYQGKGTINVGTPVTVTVSGYPAQLRAIVQNQQLYLIDNATGVAYGAGITLQPYPQSGYYSPTK